MVQIFLKKYGILCFILCIAVFLRFFQLDSNPPGLHGDEADTGYSAYSLLKTGKTQYGTFNLFALQESSGGTHPPLYTYTLLPLIKAFGLSLYVERLPSAIFGVLTVLVMYVLAFKLFQSRTIALIVAVLLTVNPWAIHISRQGLLESIALFFVTGGILFFIFASKKQLYWYVMSAVFFGLSLFSYDAPKIFLPPFLILLIYTYRHIFFSSKKIALSFVLIVSIFYMLMLKTVVLDGQIKDYTQVSIFDTNAIEETVNRERDQTLAPLWLSGIFHNKATVAADRFLKSYSAIFSLQWLFVEGQGNPQQSLAKYGQFHLFGLPAFFIGLFLLFKKRVALGGLLLGWLACGALPGGLTSGNYPYRSVLLLPMPSLCIAVGLDWMWRSMRQLNVAFKRIAQVGLIGICMMFVANYLFLYFFDYPVYASEWWAKEQNESIVYAVSKQREYTNIFFDGRWENMYAFIEKTDPGIFQYAYTHLDTYKGKPVMKIGKYTFGNFLLPRDVHYADQYFPKNSLIILDGTKLDGDTPLKEFKDPGGVRSIFKVFEVR